MKRAIDLPHLDKEVVLKTALLTEAEARFLVSNYYDMQEMRKRADMQIRHLGDRELPALLQYTADASARVEGQIVRGLEAYAKHHPVGRWMLLQDGIGPVISAGLIAYTGGPEEAIKENGKPLLDDKGKVMLKPINTVGHWWRLAGLDPTSKWEKGKIRPWSKNLKQICWHMGQCFKRISYKDDAFYGQLYRQHKAKVVERNERGYYAARAKTFFTRSEDVKKVLAQGKLPASNLDSQACRFATKIFLSHLHAVWFWDHFGAIPPKPFPIAILGHAHEIRVPHAEEFFPGFTEAYYGNR